MIEWDSNYIIEYILPWGILPYQHERILVRPAAMEYIRVDRMADRLGLTAFGGLGEQAVEDNRGRVLLSIELRTIR